MQKILIFFCFLSIVFCMQEKIYGLELKMEINQEEIPANIIAISEKEAIEIVIKSELTGGIQGYSYHLLQYEFKVDIPNVEQWEIKKQVQPGQPRYTIPLENEGSLVSLPMDAQGSSIFIKFTDEYKESQIGENRSGLPEVKMITGRITGRIKVSPPPIYNPDTGETIDTSYEESLNETVDVEVKIVGRPKSRLIVGGKELEGDKYLEAEYIFDEQLRKEITTFIANPGTVEMRLETTGYHAFQFIMSGDMPYLPLYPSDSYSFSEDGWHSQDISFEVPWMGWFPIFFDSFFHYYDSLNTDSEVVAGFYHRKALTGKWQVKFYKASGESWTEELTVEEVDYPAGSSNEIIDWELDLLGSGQEGTVLSGLTGIDLYSSYTNPVYVSGTFANPIWGAAYSFFYANVFIENGEYVIRGNLSGNTITIMAGGVDPPQSGYINFEAKLILGSVKPKIEPAIVDNSGLYITVEVPRVTSASNKPPGESTQMLSKAKAYTGDACLTCEIGKEKTTCFVDPVQHKIITFDYQLGDPVNINNLEYTEQCEDINVKSRGIEFRFQRTYKSRINYHGPLGYNWDHSYNKRFIVHPQDPNAIILYDGHGRGDAYYKGSDGKFTSPTGHYRKLIQESDGTLVLRNANGTMLYFHALDKTALSGKLLSIATRCGDRLTCSYNGEGQLICISDTYSRVASFTYNADGHIERISDFTGKEVLYGYDEAGNLISVRSPIVSGTPNGNDFPQGKEWRYTYSKGLEDEHLNHNLLTVTAPNEVATSGPSRVINDYDEDDRLIRQQWGGINASTVAAGGSITYHREVQNEGIEPDNEDLPREVVTAIDRNGNETVYSFNKNKQLIKKEEKTRNVRQGDPQSYITTQRYTQAGYLQETTNPSGSRTVYEYDGTDVDAFQGGNLISVTAYPDARGADQAFHKVTYRYEPVFNQVMEVTQTRGNDPSYTPPNGGTASPQRYTVKYIFDYFEGGLDTEGCTCGHTLRQLVDKFEIDIANIQNKLNQGDVNEDGKYNICGNLIMTQYPTVKLREGSPQSQIEGGTSQTIATRVRYNKFSQVESIETPEGEITELYYYSENDPDGDGQNILTGTNSKGQPFDASTGGFLKKIVQDASHSARYRGTATPAQLTTQYGYDASGNTIFLIDARKIRSDFVVNQLNQIVEITRASDVSQSTDSGLTAYSYKSRIYYDHNNNITKIESQYKDGNNPDLPQWLTETYTYDILDKPIETTKTVDKNKTISMRFRYDANQNLIEKLTPIAVEGTQEANKVRIEYDERDLVYRVLAAPGTAKESTITYTYDANGNVLGIRDALGNVSTHHYDGFDRLIRSVDSAGNESKIQYDPASNVIASEVWGSIGGPTRNSNSTEGNVLLAKGFACYDELSRMYQKEASLFIPSGVATIRTPLLNEDDLTPGDGKITSFMDYDRNSRPTFITAASQANALKQMRLYYDGLGRVIKKSDAGGNEQEIVYDANSNAKKISTTERHLTNRIAPETFITLNLYDSLNRLTRTTDSLGQTRRFYYDSRNLVVRSTDAQGPKISDPLGIYTEDDINEDGNSMEALHDGLGRKLQSIRYLTTQGQGGNPLDQTNPSNADGKIIETAAYDANSRLISIKDDKGNTTSYEYDEQNRITTVTFADGKTQQFTYNPNSQLISFTDNSGNVFSQTWDVLGRLTKREITRTASFKGTTLQTFEYDGLSRLTRAMDNNSPDTTQDDSQIQRQYDSLGRILEEIQNGKAVSYNWKQAATPVDLTYPDGRKLLYSLDKLNRLTSLSETGNSNPLATYDYIGSRLIERTLKNQSKWTTLNNTGDQNEGYDRLGRLIKLRHTAGTNLIAGFSYGYNRENIQVYKENLHLPTKSELYQYDSVYRLINFAQGTLSSDRQSIATPELAQTWELDGVGNWNKTTASEETKTQSINEMNEYTAFGDIPQEHDANGNLTDDGNRRFTYDALNRMVEAWTQDGKLLAQYSYDVQNRRTSKTFSRTNEEEPCEYTTDAHTLALYHFNETTGQVKDSSGNNNHGTAPNKINRKAEGLWETTAVEFHADPIKVRKSQSLDNLDDELTLEAWVYLQSPECENQHHHKTCWQKHFQHKHNCEWFSRHHCRKHLGKCHCEEKCKCHPQEHWHCALCCKKHYPKGSLIGREGSYELALKDGKASFTLFTQTPKNPGKRKCAPARTNKVTIKSSAIPLAQWVHIAAVYDGTKATLYIDSTRQPEEKAISGDIKSTSTPLHLGGEGFQGTLEEIRISSIARSTFGATITHTETIARLFYYNGWQTIEEHERTASQGQSFGPQTPYRRFTDGTNIDEHLCVEYYKDNSSTQIERTCYFHQNHRGDIVAITDESANILLRLEYTAYGEVYKIGADGELEVLSAEEKELIVYTFQGRQLDPETGLYYFRNRYYSAEQGRFLQRDPLGYVDGLGLHEAFGGSPGNFIDPLGDKILDIETGQWALDEREKQKIAELQTSITNLKSLRSAIEAEYEEYLTPQICPPSGPGAAWDYYNKEALSKLSKVDSNIAAMEQYIQIIKDWNPGWLLSRTPGAYLSGYTFDFDAYEGNLTFWQGARLSFTSGFGLGIEVGLIDQATTPITSQFSPTTMGGCFLAGTKVHTLDGTENIEDIQVDSQIITLDSENQNNYEINKVIKIYKKVVSIIYVLEFGEETISVSAEHPFWVKEKEWTQAAEIKIGDCVLTLFNKWVSLKKISQYKGIFTVYNFQVNGSHTYNVGFLGLLVHNKPMPNNFGKAINPKNLNIVGATQPEIFEGTVRDMIQSLKQNPLKFWEEAAFLDGPIEIWIIRGKSYIYNGNHRYQAALRSGVDIPEKMIKIVTKNDTNILTYPFKNMDWLKGKK